MNLKAFVQGYAAYSQPIHAGQYARTKNLFDNPISFSKREEREQWRQGWLRARQDEFNASVGLDLVVKSTN